MDFSFLSQGHVYIEGRDPDAVRVLVMNLFRTRWCGSPTGLKYSFIVIELSRKRGGTHQNYSVGSQVKNVVLGWADHTSEFWTFCLFLKVSYLKAEVVAGWVEHLPSILKASSSILSTGGRRRVFTVYIPVMKFCFHKGKYSKIDGVRHGGTHLCSEHSGSWGRRMK